MAILFNFLFLITTLQAAELPSNSFAVGRYANNKNDNYSNNLNLNKRLTIPDAEALEVTVEGETEEGYDFLIVHDSNKKPVRRLSGSLDETFTVRGSTIFINFSSDNRTTKKGVLVKITSSSLFSEIKTRLIEATKTVLKEGTKNAYVKIGSKLNEFKQLHTEVQTQTIDRVIEKAIVDLVAITQTYKDIAALNEEIMTIHQNQFKVLEGLQEETKNNVEKLKQDQKKYSDHLASAQTRRDDTSLSAVARQKEKFAIEVYNGVLQKLKKQQENWESFDNTQRLLETKLKEYSEKVGLLLYFLGINAQLYQQAANVALMRKEHISELNNLTDLPELQEIITGIANKEEEIRALLDKLQKYNE
jgi:hypothetical protein